MESEMPEHFHKLTGELLLALVLVLNMNWEVMKGRNKMPEQDC
jgi:flagellar biogenesis protein FliO